MTKRKNISTLSHRNKRLNICSRKFLERARKKFLLDSDLILELFLNRQGLASKIEKVLTHFKINNVALYITDISIEKLHFYLGIKNSQLAENSIKWLEKVQNINLINIDELSFSDLMKNLSGYIDCNIEKAIACQNNFDTIISLYPKRYKNVYISILSINEVWDNIFDNKSNTETHLPKNYQDLKSDEEIVEPEIESEYIDQFELQYCNGNDQLFKQSKHRLDTILLDVDTVIELFLNQKECASKIEKIIIYLQNINAKIYITSLSISKIYLYFGIKAKKIAEDSIIWLEKRKNLDIINFDKLAFENLIDSKSSNLDCSIEKLAACQKKVNFIVSLYPEKYTGSLFPILSIDEILMQYFSTELETKIFPNSLKISNFLWQCLQTPDHNNIFHKKNTESNTILPDSTLVSDTKFPFIKIYTTEDTEEKVYQISSSDNGYANSLQEINSDKIFPRVTVFGNDQLILSFKLTNTYNVSSGNNHDRSISEFQGLKIDIEANDKIYLNTSKNQLILENHKEFINLYDYSQIDNKNLIEASNHNFYTSRDFESNLSTLPTSNTINNIVINQTNLFPIFLDNNWLQRARQVTEQELDSNQVNEFSLLYDMELNSIHSKESDTLLVKQNTGGQNIESELNSILKSPNSSLRYQDLSARLIPISAVRSEVDIEVLKEQLEITYHLLEYQKGTVDSLTEQLVSCQTHLTRVEYDLEESRKYAEHQVLRVEDVQAVCEDLKIQLRRQNHRIAEYRSTIVQLDSLPSSLSKERIANETDLDVSVTLKNSSPVQTWSASDEKVDLQGPLSLYKKLAAMTMATTPHRARFSRRYNETQQPLKPPNNLAARIGDTPTTPRRFSVELPSFTDDRSTRTSIRKVTETQTNNLTGTPQQTRQAGIDSKSDG